ncbi:MAG: hypothetical protein IJS46_06395, partial [Kiritimatiellae bacterium]|nr:hypothetical protein [Kiritimatiellia bacterium]
MVDFAEPQAQATLFGVALTGMWFAVFASLLVLRSGVLRHLASRMRRASYPSRIVAAALFAAAVAVGGSKPGGSQPTRSLSPAPSVDSLTEADIARGFVLSRVGTDEVHSFAPPPGATVCERWQRTGSATGWTPVATNAADWAFPVGTNLVSAFRVFAFGRIDPFVPAGDALVSTDNWFSPFEATLGIVPAANWPLLPETAVPSRFWHRFTPSNTLLLTWQNALLDRSTNAPVSFQAELRPSGAFVFRYDLCDSAALREMKIGASFGGNAWTTSTIPAAVTSLSFVPVSCADLENPDRDGDGVSTADEIFRYGTDPDLPDTDLDGIPDGAEIPLGPNPLTRDTDSDGLVDGSDPDPLAATPLSDLDCDSIPDAYEQFWFGGTNAVDDAGARDGTGFTLRLKLAAGFDPTAAPSTAATAFTNQIVSWKLWDGFALDGDALAAAGTNLVFERSFAINRTSAWQQFFLSSSPTSAAPWEIHGGALEWEDSSGASGAFLRSPFTDSVRLPLAGDAVESLTLRLRATGETPFASPRPVYLVAWAPHIEVQTGQTIQLASGRLVSILTDGSASAAEVLIDRSHRPCRAPLSAEETDLSVLEGIADETNGEVWYSGDINGGAFHTYRPGVFSIPDLRPETPSPPLLRAGAKSGGAGAGHDVLSLSPRVWFGGSRCYVGGVSYDWRGGAYGIDSGYPLDTPCLRRGWEQDAAGGIACTCTYGVDAGIGPSAPDYLETSCSVDGSVCTGEIRVGGVLVWSETATHCHDENCEYGDISRLDECGGCQDGCANGNCDAVEGASLGSLKFRIPLGTPRKGQVSGFAWFEADDPVAITPSLFSVLARSDSTVSDTWSGASRRIVCSDARGRDLTVAPVENGVRVTIRTTATQALEHTWDIVNAGGSTSRIRLVKTSRLGNTMEDWTFTRDDYGVWTRLDNIARLSETLESYDGMPYGGGKVEWRTIRDADGAFLGETATYSAIVGECDNAVMRETYFAENTGSATHWRSASWWNDPKTQRHGKLRLLESNDRPWEYHDYDAQGRETLRIEQRCGAPVPAFAFGQDLTASQGFPASPEASSISNAFVTVFGCETLPGDTQSPDDFLKPRLEERYVLENGVATLVSRSWHRHTRDSSQSIPVEKHETWRAASQTSAFGDPANAYSYSVTLDENAAGVPLVARGRAVESLDEDGVLSETTVAQSSGRVVFETRKSFSGVSFPTYDVEELDATHGTVLRRETRLAATGAVIAGEQNLYDDKNRLRS